MLYPLSYEGGGVRGELREYGSTEPNLAREG